MPISSGVEEGELYHKRGETFKLKTMKVIQLCVSRNRSGRWRNFKAVLTMQGREAPCSLAGGVDAGDYGYAVRM